MAIKNELLEQLLPKHEKPEDLLGTSKRKCWAINILNL